MPPVVCAATRELWKMSAEGIIFNPFPAAAKRFGIFNKVYYLHRCPWIQTFQLSDWGIFWDAARDRWPLLASGDLSYLIMCHVRRAERFRNPTSFGTVFELETIFYDTVFRALSIFINLIFLIAFSVVKVDLNNNSESGRAYFSPIPVFVCLRVASRLNTLRSHAAY